MLPAINVAGTLEKIVWTRYLVSVFSASSGNVFVVLAVKERITETKIKRIQNCLDHPIGSP
jgi:hypothetical protein